MASVAAASVAELVGLVVADSAVVKVDLAVVKVDSAAVKVDSAAVKVDSVAVLAAVASWAFLAFTASKPI